MKNFFPQKMLAVTALALAMAGSAFAADLPHYKAPPPPPPPPPPMWTGFYVGLNAGYTWSERSWVATNAANLQFCGAGCAGGAAAATASVFGAGAPPILWSARNDGFIGGGQVGYNFQFGAGSFGLGGLGGGFVAGVEADIQGVAGSSGSTSGFNNTVLPGFPPTFSIFTFTNVTRNLDYLGTVRGRLGWLFTPTLLVYGTGGLAYGGVSSNTSIFQAYSPTTATAGIGRAWGTAGSFSDTRVGWTVGGGLEWMFWPNWSAKVEYLYYNLGAVTYNTGALIDPLLVAVAGSPAFFINPTWSHADFNGHIVRAGVNYHFNWGAPPVVAKY